MKLSIIIPVYNERATVCKLIEKVQAVPYETEIIVVDDGSTDGTVDLLKRLPSETIKLLLHKNNKGKGAALRTGIAEVTGDYVIIQDADLEYDPSDYKQLLEPLLDGRADVVYGSRFLGGPHRVLFFWHYVGNSLLTLMSNMLNNLNLSDMETCYKAFRTPVLKEMKLKSDRFGFEPEITAKVAKKRCRVYEVPISYSGRDYAEGKKITWRDGISAFYWIIRFWLFD